MDSALKDVITIVSMVAWFLSFSCKINSLGDSIDKF